MNKGLAANATLAPLAKVNTHRPITRAFGRDITNSQDLPQDPQTLDVYLTPILAHLHVVERQHLPDRGYMERQPSVNEKMRAILLDWLVEVCVKFRLTPETYYLTVNLLDRYLTSAVVQRNQLQLVGVTCLLLACKYEEIYPPEVRDFVYITDSTYTREEVLSMELEVLRVLEFNLTTPSSYRFLELYSKLVALTPPDFALATYLLELATIEYKILRYTPSLLASSAIYLTNKIRGRPTSHMQRHPENDVKRCAKDLCILLQGADRCTLTAVRKKFSSEMYFEVAKIEVCMQRSR